MMGETACAGQPHDLSRIPENWDRAPPDYYPPVERIDDCIRERMDGVFEEFKTLLSVPLQHSAQNQTWCMWDRVGVTKEDLPSLLLLDERQVWHRYLTSNIAFAV